MNNIIIELIDKNRKNSRLSAADRELYEGTLFDELSIGNYDDEIEKVLCEGPADSTMKALAQYLTSIEKGDAYSFLQKFINCDKFMENKGGVSGTRMVFLVTWLINTKKEQDKLIELAFNTMVWFGYTKENSKFNKKVVDQIRNSIFPLFEERDSILDLHFINKEKSWCLVRDLFIESMMNLEKTSFGKIQKVYYWLKSSGRNMGKYTEDYITKITLEQTENKKENIIDIPEKKNSPKIQFQKKVLTDDSSQIEKQLEQVKQEKAIVEKNTTVESKKDNDEKKTDTNKVLSELIAITLAGYENQKNVNLELESLTKKIIDMQLQINKLLSKEEQQKEYIQELISEKRELTAVNCSDEEKIKELTELVEKLKLEIDDRKQFTDTVTRNREKQSEEQLNKLAAKLRVDYRDFCDAKDIEMTVDLGENMREQLGTVFSILQKNGIKLS